MKSVQPINTKRLFIFPLLLFFFITLTVGFLTYTFTVDRFKTEMTTSGSLLAETLSLSLSNNLAHKEDYIDSIDSLLVSVGNNIINHRDLITNEYLHEMTEIFVLTNIYWYNEDGQVLYDANSEYIGWTPQIGDPIYNFMHSGLDVYIEEIREGTDEVGEYYKFVYVRAEDGFFIQVGCNADVIYELTQKYEYQYVLDQFVENNPELLYALIVDTNYINIADTDIDEIGIDYSGDSVYEKVLLGETNSDDWYHEKIGKDVLEIATPIYFNGEIIGILGIGYSYDNYNLMKVFFITIFISLIVIILTFYTLVQYVKIINPLKKFSGSVSNIDLNHITYRTAHSDYGGFSGLSKMFTDLVNKVFEKNKENSNIIAQMTNLAFTDQLTQLPNRNAIIKHLKEMCINKNQVAIIFMDINDFKTINDTKGHAFGNLLLQEIGKNLSTLKNNQVYVARQQSDEFFILYQYTHLDEVTDLIENIKSLFNFPIKVEELNIMVELSMSISLYPKDGISPDELLKKTDIAMYEAKKNQQTVHKFYDTKMEESVIRKNEVLDILKNAIRNDGFSIVYQPQVNIYTEEIISLEALLRIKDSNISPYEFIPIAEQNRLISKIGRIVIMKVIEQQSRWCAEGIEIVPVYVNYSASQLEDQTLNEYIVDILKQFNIPSEMIGIELTESAIIENRDLTIKTLSEMKSLGIKTAIDDFGSGQAGINYLTNFKVDMVKFDKSFSDQFLMNDQMDIYYTILELTQKLGFISLAEGIEREEQIDLLKTTSCRLVQGYYYYKPSKPEIISDILSKNVTIKSKKR